MYERNQVGQLLVSATLTVAVLLGPASSTVSANGIIIAPPPVETIRPPEPRPPELRPPWHRPPHHPRRPIHDWMPLAIKSQQVDVSINDAAAETAIVQVFANRSGRQVEGTYLFPVPEIAAVHDFSMFMNGKKVTAELLDADKARQIYESIVSRMKDPALLECAGFGLIRAKVFPIPANGECRIELKYTQPVRIDSDMGSFRFPLKTQGCRLWPIEQFSFKATLRSTRYIADVFSPSHTCSIDRHGELEVVVGLEQSDLIPDRDLQLFYRFGDQAMGLTLLTHRAAGEDGFFMARIVPRVGEQAIASMPKNICFVLDTSGSMADSQKIDQAKKAMRFCIANLGEADRFNIISFATEVRKFTETWNTTESEQLAAARDYIDALKAIGGTDIDQAIREALSMRPMPCRGRGAPLAWTHNPYFIVFITDGEPTVGVTLPEEILANIAKANEERTSRVFVLGVGHQVNTKLLDRMADDNGGARDYVTPSEDLELKLSAFYMKLAHPILADLALAFRGVSVHDVYPKKLPDLFKGSQLVVLGRYGGDRARSAEIELSGRQHGGAEPHWQQAASGTDVGRAERRSYCYTGEFPAARSDNAYLPRLWAMRKIGYLLDELRLHGENKELKDEVVRLSKKYGIMTPYTSYLVHEDEEVAQRMRRAPSGGRSLRGALGGVFVDNAQEMEEARDGQVAFKGARSVGASQSNLTMQGAEADAAAQLMERVSEFNRDSSGNRLINFLGAKTFYRDGEKWVDSKYDGKAKPVILRLFSKEYFDFVAANTEAGQYLAQGDCVVLCWNGRVFETQPGPPSVGTLPTLPRPE
ncbi:MAG: VIT and VWA domain-containing protein [Planctomycetota bacterium]